MSLSSSKLPLDSGDKGEADGSDDDPGIPRFVGRKGVGATTTRADNAPTERLEPPTDPSRQSAARASPQGPPRGGRSGDGARRDHQYVLRRTHVLLLSNSNLVLAREEQPQHLPGLAAHYAVLSRRKRRRCARGARFVHRCVVRRRLLEARGKGCTWGCAWRTSLHSYVTRQTSTVVGL